MRSVLGVLASIPFIFVIPGMIVVLSFARTYFDADAFQEKIIPNSYNSATLLLSEHFSGRDRELTSILVERIRALITPADYSALLQESFNIVKAGLDATSNEAQKIEFNFAPVKAKLTEIAQEAPRRVETCSDEEIRKNMILFCIPREFSNEESKEKLKETLKSIIEKEIPANFSYTFNVLPIPTDSPSPTETPTQTDLQFIKAQLNTFMVNAYMVHRGLAFAFFMMVVVYCVIQAIIQFSLARVMYFAGGLLVTVGMIVNFIVRNASEFPTFIAMQSQFSYAQEHLIRFLINEPLPLLRNMSFGIALVGIMIIGCGVLYSRQKKIRATDETTL